MKHWCRPRSRSWRHRKPRTRISLGTETRARPGTRRLLPRASGLFRQLLPVPGAIRPAHVRRLAVRAQARHEQGIDRSLDTQGDVRPTFAATEFHDDGPRIERREDARILLLILEHEEMQVA